MLGRNWLHHFAIRGCLAASLCGLLSGPCEAQGDNAAPAAQPQQQQPKTEPTPLPITQQAEKKPDPDYFKRSCDHPKQREDDDLCQQVRMAQAAEEAVYWAEWQTKIGIGGLIGVALSLIFSGWASFAAARAAKAAERAIVVENRPWIRFEPKIASDLNFTEHGGYIKFEITFKNVGGGPARLVVVDSGEISFYAQDPLADLNAWIVKYIGALEKTTAEAITVFPGETYTNEIWSRLTREMMDKASPPRDGKQMFSPVVVFGIFYRSTLDDEALFYTVSAYLLGRHDKERGINQAILVEDKIDGRTLMLERYLGLSRAK